MFKKAGVVALVISLILPGVISAQEAAQEAMPDFQEMITAEGVMAHVEALSVDIGARPMGSEEEEAAADYIAEQFKSYGYEVEIQEFETISPDSGETVTSWNVIATLEGESDEMIVIGAHMDSVTDATGAGDNASGVAVILTAAEALADIESDYTLVFIAFGAEENGDPPGADVYVENLDKNIENVVAMLNIDSVGVGTNLNVYAGAVITWGDDEDAPPVIEGQETWVRDLALALADEMELPFGTSPDESWGGFTGDWSDHYAFVLAEIPIAYVEAWQWEGAEDIWWGQETADGDVMHTPGDVFENVVPDKVEMTAELVAATVYTIATEEDE